MTHMRTQVRDYAVTRLTNRTVASGRVYNAKFIPEHGPFPIINVVTTSERTEQILGKAPLILEKSFNLHIELAVKALDDFMTTLDALEYQVEPLIDFTLGGLVKECVYQSSEISVDARGETPLAFSKVTYKVLYDWMEAGATDEDLADLLKLYTDFDLADPNDGSASGPDGQIDMQTIVDFSPEEEPEEPPEEP
jgi:hypothetical protein